MIGVPSRLPYASGIPPTRQRVNLRPRHRISPIVEEASSRLSLLPARSGVSRGKMRPPCSRRPIGGQQIVYVAKHVVFFPCRHLMLVLVRRVSYDDYCEAKLSHEVARQDASGGLMRMAEASPFCRATRAGSMSMSLTCFSEESETTMVRGFLDINASSSLRPDDPARNRLQTGSVLRAESVMAMEPGWRKLAESSELLTTQIQWALASIKQLVPGMHPHIAYVNDGSLIRAILPMRVQTQMGIEHFHYLSPNIPVPIDIPHLDRPSLDLLLRYVIGFGRPVVLDGMIANSPAIQAIRALATDKKAIVRIDPADSDVSLDLERCPLQDRSQNAARASILATSYGLSGGPSDVLFQFVSPPLDQVMNLFREAIQIENPAGDAPKPARSRSRGINTSEFLRSHVYQCAQHGEVRFSGIRISGQLLGMQVFQCREKTAWLVKSGHMERFRGTMLPNLLMGETIRKLREEGMQRIVVPAGGKMQELGPCQEIPRVNIRINPWNTRSIAAMVIGSAGEFFARKKK